MLWVVSGMRMLLHANYRWGRFFKDEEWCGGGVDLRFAGES